MCVGRNGRFEVRSSRLISFFALRTAHLLRLLTPALSSFEEEREREQSIARVHADGRVLHLPTAWR